MRHYNRIRRIAVVLLIISVLLSPVKNVLAITPETGIDTLALVADAALCFQGSTADCGWMIFDIFAIAIPMMPGSYAPKLAGKTIEYGEDAIQIAKGSKISIEAAASVDDINVSKKVILGPYKQIRSYFSKAGKVEAHHLLEHRNGKVAEALGLSVDDMISIPLETGFHDVISARWAAALSRSGEYGDSISDIFRYAQATCEVYKDMPQLRNAALYQVIASPKFLAYAKSLTNASKAHFVYDVYTKYGLDIKGHTQSGAFSNPFYAPFEEGFNTYGFGFETCQYKAYMNAAIKFNADDFLNDLYTTLDVPYPQRIGFELADDNNNMSEVPIDVTSQFANKTVMLKSVNTCQYVCGENNSTVHADGDCGSDNKGIYRTTLTADGWLGFQLKGGKWLSVQNLDYLRTEGNKLSSWECFRIYQKGNDYYLLSQKNNKFVQVQMEEPAKPLKAARPYTDGLEGATWERFNIEIIDGIRVYLENRPLSFAVQPMEINGRIMVPLRAIFEAIGAIVTWDEVNQKAIAEKGSTTVQVVVGSNQARINGSLQTLDVPPTVIDGSILAPLRFVAEAFGNYVKWVDAEKAAYISEVPFAPNGDIEYGNTSGNLNNNGNMCQKGDWVYYCGVASDAHGLYRMKADGSYSEKINNGSLWLINIVGEWIYYSNRDDEGKLYKQRLDGSGKEKLSDVLDLCELMVADDWVYFSNGDPEWEPDKYLYRIKTDGSKQQKLVSDRPFCIDVAGDYVYYTNDSDHGYLYRVKSDGSLREKINSDSSWYIDVIGEWIYYCNISDEGKLYKIMSDGTGREKLVDDKAWNINVSGGWIYYLNGQWGGPIYRIRMDGTDREKLTNDSVYPFFIVGDWVYFYSYDMKCYRMKLDGSSCEQVFTDMLF